MRPNKDRRTGIILYGLLLIPLLFAAAALAQATEQAQGLAEITAVLSSIHFDFGSGKLVHVQLPQVCRNDFAR